MEYVIAAIVGIIVASVAIAIYHRNGRVPPGGHGPAGPGGPRETPDRDDQI